MASAERTARAALEGSRFAEAVGSFSILLQEELRSPWEPDAQCMTRWAAGLGEAQRGYRWNRKAPWSALELKVASGDSLIALRKRALAERPELVTCTGLIARANQLQGETIQPGQTIRVPTGKPRVLVDLSARWLLFLLEDEVVAAWPIGVGKKGSETTPGRYKVGEKSTDPTWFRAGQQPVPAGDERNPLGTRWIAWISESGENTHLGIHGTRDPESIGREQSEGCVRMLNAHVEELYEILPRNTEILVQP
jgi:lipoprotein-anchoring transpeptidase ErfK/SrfK